MYYSYKCTYCGREFYTFDSNREQASKTLYRSVKQHLIDYNEDHKEHELDDGEAADSNQIYQEMVESRERPAGGYEATQTEPVGNSNHGASGNSNSSEGGSHNGHNSTVHTSATTLILLLILLAIVGILFLFPGFLDFFRQHMPQL